MLYAFKQAIAYRFEVFVWMASQLIFMYMFVRFWSALYENRTIVEGVTLRQVITYSVMSVLIGNMLGDRTGHIISQKVRKGEIIFDFLKPIDFMSFQLSLHLGQAFTTFLFRVIPGFLIASILFGIDLPASNLAAVAFFASLLLGLLITFMIDFMLGLLAFMFIETWGFFSIKGGFIWVLGGALVPIWLYPDWLRPFVETLPFKTIFYSPLAIYIGKIQGGDVFSELALQLFWLTLLTGFARIMQRKLRFKLVIYGG